MLLVATTSANDVYGADKNKKGQNEYSLITPNATKETVVLYNTLVELQGKALLFGQHYANVIGLDFTDWGQTMNKCDMQESVGDYPAIFGFDFGRGFDKQLPAVKKAAMMGGIITFSDHVPNPYNLKSYKHIDEMSNVEIKSVLPGGEHHEFLIERLDQIADFASKAVLKGKKIPIIYRPWHEHTGRWFWWGCESGTEEEYNALWRFTVEYLRDQKKVDNFIFAFSPSYQSMKDGYELRNPGAEYFDIAGVDIYTADTQDQQALFDMAVKTTVEYAVEHNKIAALTEFGYRGGIQNNNDPRWFTDIFLDTILSTEYGRKIVFALTWSNSRGGFWVPLKDDPNYDSFKELYDNQHTMFLKDWKNQ